MRYDFCASQTGVFRFEEIVGRGGLRLCSHTGLGFLRLVVLRLCRLLLATLLGTLLFTLLFAFLLAFAFGLGALVQLIQIDMAYGLQRRTRHLLG